MKEIYIETAKEGLQRQGYKLTGPRLAIIRYLAGEKGHPDIRQIFTRIRSEHPGIGIATVYRTVDLLLELGFLRAITIKKNQLRYEVNWPGDHHHHLVCKGCGRVIEFGSCNFQLISKEIEKVTRFRIEEHILEAYGLCHDCLPGKQHYSTEKM